MFFAQRSEKMETKPHSGIFIIKFSCDNTAFTDFYFYNLLRCTETHSNNEANDVADQQEIIASVRLS